MPARRIALISAGLVVGVGIGFTTPLAVAAHDDDHHAPGVDLTTGEEYPVNGAGLTFGSGLHRAETARPDLIRTRGDDGRVGYVFARDLDGTEPTTPEEAVEIHETARTIALYAEDGTTMIGQFTIEPSIAGEAAK